MLIKIHLRHMIMYLQNIHHILYYNLQFVHYLFQNIDNWWDTLRHPEYEI